MSENKQTNPFSSSSVTETRHRGLSEAGEVVVVTQAFGPQGENLIAKEGPRFSGEPGIKLRVKQGDIEDDVYLSPFFGDPSKIHTAAFKDGVPCELFCPSSGHALDKIPGMSTDEGGEFYAVYLTPRLGRGEMVAINNIWGNASSRMLSEDELLAILAEAEEKKFG